MTPRRRLPPLWSVMPQLAIVAAACSSRETMSTANGSSVSTGTSSSGETVEPDATASNTPRLDAAAPLADTSDAQVLDGAVSANDTRRDLGVTTLDESQSTQGKLQGSDAGAGPDAAPTVQGLDAGSAEDVASCERACAAGADLPCHTEHCVAYCLDDLSRPCATTYRAFVQCLATRDGSEYSCDQDNDLVAPVACAAQQERFIECLLE